MPRDDVAPRALVALAIPKREVEMVTERTLLYAAAGIVVAALLMTCVSLFLDSVLSGMIACARC